MFLLVREQPEWLKCNSQTCRGYHNSWQTFSGNESQLHCLLFKKRGGFTARPGVLKLQQLSLNFGESCVRGLSSFPPWGLQNPYCENSGGLLNLFFVCTFFSTIVQFCTRVIKFLLLGSPWALAQSWALRHQRKTMRNSLAQNPRLPCVEVQRCKCHVL